MENSIWAHYRAQACPEMAQGVVLELGLAFENCRAPKIMGDYEEKRVNFEKVWKIAFGLTTGPRHAQKWPKEWS